MKKIFIFGLSIFSLVVTVIQVDAAKVYGCIKGRVLNAENSTPLYGANVIIVGAEKVLMNEINIIFSGNIRGG